MYHAIFSSALRLSSCWLRHVQGHRGGTSAAAASQSAPVDSFAQQPKQQGATQAMPYGYMPVRPSSAPRPAEPVAGGHGRVAQSRARQVPDSAKRQPGTGQSSPWVAGELRALVWWCVPLGVVSRAVSWGGAGSDVPTSGPVPGRPAGHGLHAVGQRCSAAGDPALIPRMLSRTTWLV